MVCRSLALRDVRDIKRLYLSGACVSLAFPCGASNPRADLAPGNPLDAGFISEACYNLVYLELAACRLTALPRDFARLAPNLRVLNLNYNFLDDVRPLEGLVRLRRVTIIGSRVSATRQFVRVLRGLADAEMVDFRRVSFFSWLPERFSRADTLYLHLCTLSRVG